MKIKKSGVLLLSSLLISIDAFSTEKTAETLAIEFYKSYFNYLYSEFNDNPPKLPFSSNFRQLIDKSNKACELYEPGICGWDAHYDIYTNAQDSDETLTFDNSRFTSTPLPDNKVRVTFNLFPSNPDPYYDRVITFKFTFENNIYVVDDILYGDDLSSKVDLINKEIDSIKKHPSPESKYCIESRIANDALPKECL